MGVQGLKPSFVHSRDQLGIYAALFVCCTIVLLVLGMSIGFSTFLGEQLSDLLILHTKALAGTAVIDSIYHIKKLRKDQCSSYMYVSECLCQ